MAESIEIRVLTPADADAFLEIRLTSLRTDPEAFIMSTEEEERETAESMIARICSRNQPPERFVVGAFVDHQLVGTSAFYQETWANLRHKGELWGVYVKSEYRQQGIARCLVIRTIELARLISGLEQIKLEVSGSMQKRFYETLGFKSWGIEVGCTKIGSTQVTWEHMTLRL